MPEAYLTSLRMGTDLNGNGKGEDRFNHWGGTRRVAKSPLKY